MLRDAGREDLAKSLEDAAESVRQERFVIGVMGAAKRGKSTLINGLLGRNNDDCAPIAMAPTTNAISIFGHEATPKTTVRFHNRPEQPEMITESEIRFYATEKHNPKNKKGVRSIEVLAPFDGLEKGVFLVDTPGAGNALEQMHTDVLLSFLPNADAVIFLVTGEKPITDPEKVLLSTIRKNQIGKLFFAVNMVDRIDSGDITADGFAQGIQHNRQVLDSIGLHPKLYRISAKNYFETRHDAGTEELLHDIRETVGKERLVIQARRLRDRTSAAVEACGQALDREWQEATAGKEQWGLDLDGLRNAKTQLERGRSAREEEFRRTWSWAFSQLEDDLTNIRRQMKKDYAELIETTPALKIAALCTSLYADVVTRFGELLEPKMQDCEDAILRAQKKLSSDVQATTLRAAPQLERIATPLSLAQGAMEIALAGLPAIATATLAAGLPGWIGAMIIASAPTVAVATLNPLTWLTALGSGAAATIVTTAGATFTAALTVAAAPVAFIAFGLAGYRISQAWKQQQNKNKNTLADSVREQIEEAYEQVLLQLRKCKERDSSILNSFNRELEREINSIEERLDGLIRKQPSERDILLLEERLRNFTAQAPLLLSAPASVVAPKDDTGGSALVDSLL